MTDSTGVSRNREGIMGLVQQSALLAGSDKRSPEQMIVAKLRDSTRFRNKQIHRSATTTVRPSDQDHGKKMLARRVECIFEVCQVRTLNRTQSYSDSARKNLENIRPKHRGVLTRANDLKFPSVVLDHSVAEPTVAVTANAARVMPRRRGVEHHPLASSGSVDSIELIGRSPFASVRSVGLREAGKPWSGGALPNAALQCSSPSLQCEQRAIDEIASVDSPSRWCARGGASWQRLSGEISAAVASRPGNAKSLGRPGERLPGIASGTEPSPLSGSVSAVTSRGRSIASCSSARPEFSSRSANCPSCELPRVAASWCAADTRASRDKSDIGGSAAELAFFRRGDGSPERRRSSAHSAMQASICACTDCSYSSAIFARNREARSKREIRNVSRASSDDIARYSSTDLFASIHGSLAYGLGRHSMGLRGLYINK
jgi:hypothetical protein